MKNDIPIGGGGIGNDVCKNYFIMLKICISGNSVIVMLMNEKLHTYWKFV